jgi:hypothetical protein
MNVGDLRGKFREVAVAVTKRSPSGHQAGNSNFSQLPSDD